MNNLYKKKFPKRSRQQFYKDILRMDETKLRQFVEVAKHFEPSDYKLDHDITTQKKLLYLLENTLD